MVPIRLGSGKAKSLVVEGNWHFELTHDVTFLDSLRSENFLKRSPVVVASKGLYETKKTERRKSDSTHEESTLSIDGSPLKLQTFEVETHDGYTRTGQVSSAVKPHTAADARRILSEYAQGACSTSDTELNPLPPVILYCDGRDSEALAFLGLAVTNTDHATTTSSYKIASKGPYLYENKDKLPNVNKLINRHFPQNCKVNTHYQSEYDIISSGSHLHNVSMTSQSSASLMLSVEWTQGSSLLHTPPRDANTTAEVVVCPGDMRSVAHSLYMELLALQGFSDGLAEGLVKWAVHNADQPLIERVQALIEGVKRGEGIRKQKAGDDTSLNTPALSIHRLDLDERQDLDFTEQLWNILKDCSSYNELVQCFEYVFTQLKLGELQPMIHKSNVCTLAQLIRASYRDEMQVPALQGLTPLQMLVEIGIEKLQRDFTNVFIGKELAAASHLEHFVTKRGSLEERVVLLDKLQHTLELIAMLSQYLELPRASLGTATRRTLKHYETRNIEPDHVFRVPVSTSHVFNHIESTMPRMWQVELSGEVDGVIQCAVYIATPRQLFPHIALKDATPVQNHNDTSTEEDEEGDNRKQNGVENGGHAEEDNASVYITVATQNIITLQSSES